MPTLEAAKPEASSARANASAALGPTIELKPACAPSIVSTSPAPEPWNSDAAMISIDMLMMPGDAHRDRHVDPLEAQQPAALALVARRGPALGERRMQVDHVRHHGGAEDAGGQQQRVGALEARDEAAGDPGGVVRDHQRVDQEAEQDHAEHPGDHDLEPPVAARLQAEQPERDDGGDETGGQQRHAEQQVERDRRADELREVGRHRDQLRLDPQAERDRPREPLAAQLGEAAPVAMPTFADRSWISIAIRFAPRITHSSR